MIHKEFSVTTDTATLSIFDVASLAHRLEDTPDWWSIDSDALQEMNEGNVLFLNLREDGTYRIALTETLTEEYSTLYLNVPSGKVFIGAGEDTTGGDLEPDDPEYISGELIQLPVGAYEVRFAKQDDLIQLMFLPATQSTNNLNQSVRI